MKIALVSLAALLVLGVPGSGISQGKGPGGGSGGGGTAPSCPSDRLVFAPGTSAELQTALDCAAPGATITLNAGAASVYRGNFPLRHKPLEYEADGTTPKRITIQSAAVSSLPEATRVIPAQDASMAWLEVPPGSTAPVLAAS